MTVQDQLTDIVQQMERGDFNAPRAASPITIDEETGILTIVSMNERGTDSSHYAFRRMAYALGYSKVN